VSLLFFAPTSIFQVKRKLQRFYTFQMNQKLGNNLNLTHVVRFFLEIPLSFAFLGFEDKSKNGVVSSPIIPSVEAASLLQIQAPPPPPPPALQQVYLFICIRNLYFCGG